MRAVGPQPKSIARPCFACKKGLNGRKYCPICGNTTDYGDVPFYREKPLDEQPRSSREITQAMSQATGLQRGVKYRVKIEVAPERYTTFEGICLWTSGPFARFSTGHDVNTLEIRSCDPIV